MESNFNLEKYLSYQKQLFDKWQQNEIDTTMYTTLSIYHNEVKHITSEIEKLQNYINEKNLPFTVEYITFNIQTLMSSNSKFLKNIDDVFKGD